MANARSAGDVSVRFSVPDAEVVRSKLEAFGKDGQVALKRIAAAAAASVAMATVKTESN